RAECISIHVSVMVERTVDDRRTQAGIGKREHPMEHALRECRAQFVSPPCADSGAPFERKWHVGAELRGEWEETRAPEARPPQLVAREQRGGRVGGTTAHSPRYGHPFQHGQRNATAGLRTFG